MDFDISDFKSPPVEKEYTLNGKMLKLWIDSDILTPEFLDEALALSKTEGDAAQDQRAQVAFFVNVLSRAISSWTAKNKGVPVLPSVEFLRTVPIERLADLFELCMEGTVKKQQTTMTSPSLTTPAIIPDGSQATEDSDVSPAM